VPGIYDDNAIIGHTRLSATTDTAGLPGVDVAKSGTEPCLLGRCRIGASMIWAAGGWDIETRLRKVTIIEPGRTRIALAFIAALRECFSSPAETISLERRRLLAFGAS
jgi:hypothetical protein